MSCRPLENLSRRQRQATPPAFAAYLIGLVREAVPSERVAALWVAGDTAYRRFWPDVELWDIDKDANRYPGPWPVICHPPCGPWGKYRLNCRHARQDGVNALAFAHRWGGVVEHPVGSSLFREHGRPGAEIVRVNQSEWGHPALKPTLLYIVREPDK